MSCKPKKLGCKIKIPKIGIGTWRLHDSMKTEAALYKALELGYRHLDTAYIYGNEVSIGKALKRWFKKGHSRKELFITSKLPPFGLRDEDVSRYLCETLKRLQLQYIDLYLAHVPFGFFASKSITLDHQNAGSWNWPSSLNTKNAIKWDYATDHVEVWKAMEQEVDLKRTRHIGLSNFNISQIENVLKHCRIKPACLQVEIHPYLQQKKLSVFCHNNDIVLVAYSPLGSMGNSVSDDFAPAMYDTTVEDIARELGVTPAQVVLAYIMHLGAIPIPQTDDPNYLKDNFGCS
ncbi:alcohol dehydrogenase [NADP(+)]-like [Ctenocephalides felis]|uniref:alcohol dehydrogenase [NADP(+)]-like n=1 Tax=Ctenocephalides felis TaxID=7515 RepID=UPI000E6E4528|nr:alcohol dehydrogenase [NADP(+)]-like [Ctenocephalides felis]